MTKPKRDYNPSKAHQDAMGRNEPEPNPIEEAIGDRAKEKLSQADLQKVAQDVKKAVEQKISTMKNPGFPLDRDKIQNEPSPSEMVTLEELNRQTEERLQDQYPEEEPQTGTIPQESTTLPPVSIGTVHPSPPVLKPDLQPVTKTSSPESPPQKIEEIDEYLDAEKHEPGVTKLGDVDLEKHIEQYNKTAEKIGIPKIIPAEDIELTNLRKYILEDGFVLATVAFHIVALCAQPMTTPSTTMWDFKDRANIPDMVLALLNQPGYLEGIWPSLRIVMSSNKGNAAWCAGIATTIAFFDVIRTLPALVELQKDVAK